MAPSAVHNLEVLRVLAVSEVFSLGNIFYTPRYWEHLWRYSFTDRWSLEWEIEQITFPWGNWSTWRILAGSSSIYFRSILRVLAVFPGSIYSGYSDLLQSISDVCTAGAACVLGVLYTTHHVPSTRSIWAFSTADTPSIRSINLGHEYRNTLSTSGIQSIEPKHTYITLSMSREISKHTYITLSMSREIYLRSTDRYS